LKLEQVPRFPVDRLIIETKASGISVIQELHRLYSGRGDFGVEGVDPSRWGDKTARLYAVQHMFQDEMIYYPENRRFSDMVMDQVSSFPKGAHDDLVDSTSLALRYLRLSGLLQRREEYARDIEEQSLHRSREKPLYW
jgi:predicted phage terminase large subunit-like protein